MKTYLEKAIENIPYDNLGIWCIPNIYSFSDKITLFEYQVNALKNIAKVLNTYYEADNSKEKLFELCEAENMSGENFHVPKYNSRIAKTRKIINRQFDILKEYFPVLEDNGEEYISGVNFFNRACFWMATGSGKTLLIIKTIEYIDYLQRQNLIPQKEIMLLFPRDDLINQFKEEVYQFNKGKEKPLELISLKDYEEEKQRFDFQNTIKAYYYRSNLLKDETKENELDYKVYDNFGNWYIFLDEAHRGNKEDSLMQNYVTALSRNGFLFNFSATFIEPIDFATTCYNFNLEKFIEAGYGKNIYLSESYFNFTSDTDDFTEKEKQKQVLKSFIILTLIKKSREDTGYYHNPLLMTLVNSVNTDDSDLKLFFREIETIASMNFSKDLFKETKEEILRELTNNRNFFFGEEQLDFDRDLLNDLVIQDIQEKVFNTATPGKIEILEGEKGKEIVLKLETSDSPFALIKIGDATKFEKESLGDNYSIISSYENRRFFEEINENEDINILLGSRAFYEGWDSNRPNIINLINIGVGDARKYVLQALGRGIRIEPIKDKRKRLSFRDDNKNILLETLFVFSTDKAVVKKIIEAVSAEKEKESDNINIIEPQEKPFDLLIPEFHEDTERPLIKRFGISRESLDKLKNYFSYFTKELFILKYGVNRQDYDFLSEQIYSEELFLIEPEVKYFNMELLLQKIISHISIKSKTVGRIKELENEIVHFKHVKVYDMKPEDIEILCNTIKNVKEYDEEKERELAWKFYNREISKEEFRKLQPSPEEYFKDLKIKRIQKHYYVPLIYSERERVEYIKNIIDVESEVRFIKNLEDFISNNETNVEWMFSKIKENKDHVFIPYYYKKENTYSKFFPDFIFWIKRERKYKIVYVDPKGTSNTDYENKVDEFEKLFIDSEGNKKEFNYNGYNIVFDLKLIGEDIDNIGEKYRDYWLSRGDFSFLDI